MTIIVEMYVQCDVCGNDLEDKYPARATGHTSDEFDAEIIADLWDDSLTQIKERGWGYNPTSTRTDHWGFRTTIRCHECRQARRWE